MKPKGRSSFGAVVVAFACWAALLAMAQTCGAEDPTTWFGPPKDFEWSDYRASAGFRVYMAKLVSGSVSGFNYDHDLRGGTYAMISHPDPYTEFWGVLWIDRLGLRLQVDEQNVVGESRNGRPPSELKATHTRLGLDLDIYRHPWVKLGINADYDFGKLKFWDRSFTTNPPSDQVLYHGERPVTWGWHGRVVPFRLREVPVTLQARLRTPVPFLEKFTSVGKAKLYEWEVSAGLRPAVWETSWLGHSTFSASIEVGYRWTNFQTPIEASFLLEPREMTLKSRWEGGFFQFALFY